MASAQRPVFDKKFDLAIGETVTYGEVGTGILLGTHDIITDGDITVGVLMEEGGTPIPFTTLSNEGKTVDFTCYNVVITATTAAKGEFRSFS